LLIPKIYIFQTKQQPKKKEIRTHNNDYTPTISLVASRVFLALVALITTMLLIMTLLLVRKENIMNDMSKHCFGYVKLHFHLFTQQP
jgi:hypothetical protein